MFGALARSRRILVRAAQINSPEVETEAYHLRWDFRWERRPELHPDFHRPVHRDVRRRRDDYRPDAAILQYPRRRCRRDSFLSRLDVRPAALPRRLDWVWP